MVGLIVYTARLPHHKVPGYAERDALDVTRGSGGNLGAMFAPSRPLLTEAQRRKSAAKRDQQQLVEAWEWYAPRYLDEMRQLWRTDKRPWKVLWRLQLVTLCCYCGTVERCHRTLLGREILGKLGADFRGERGAAPPPARDPGEEG